MSIVLTQTSTRVRKTLIPSYSDGAEASIGLTPRGETLVSSALPRFTEMVRTGDAWYGKGVVTTATLGQAVPTTTAASTLWNGNSAGGKSLVVQGVGFLTDVSGGAANILTIWAAPSIVSSATVPSTVEAGTFNNLRLGRGTYGGNAKISQAVTVTDTGWLPLKTMTALAANKGIGAYIELNGLFVIPPGYYLALASVGTATTMEVGYYYVFSEVQLELP